MRSAVVSGQWSGVRVLASRIAWTASRASDSSSRVGQIFFAELDVVDSGAGGFGDFLEETATARGFVCGEGGAVGDAVEKAAFSHRSGLTGAEAQSNLTLYAALKRRSSTELHAFTGIERCSFPLRSRLRDLGQDLAFFLQSVAEVVAGQAVAKELEGFLRDCQRF